MPMKRQYRGKKEKKEREKKKTWHNQRGWLSQKYHSQLHGDNIGQFARFWDRRFGKLFLKGKEGKKNE